MKIWNSMKLKIERCNPDKISSRTKKLLGEQEIKK